MLRIHPAASLAEGGQVVPLELPDLVRRGEVEGRSTRADHTDNRSSRVGGKRAGRAWRCRDLRDAGVPVVLGSDWPIALTVVDGAIVRRR